MDRADRPAVGATAGVGVPTFFADGALGSGASLDLGDDAVQHARARRIAVGERVRLTNGVGTLADADVVRCDRSVFRVDVRVTHTVAPHTVVRLFVPVADRDRMLWLAEKAAELSVSAWQPVMFRRSRSVSPRGEGESFRRKVRARMISALEQSGGAWLPIVEGERSLDDVLELGGAQESRYLLDRGGAPLIAVQPSAGADVMLGPEGGLEPAELDDIVTRHAWIPVSLGEGTLRFETAGVLAVGIVRARLRDS